MLASEIQDLVRKSRVLSRHFVAVIDASEARQLLRQVKREKRRNAFWICNLTDAPGSHWWLCFITQDGFLQCFDSLG